mgnify:CR=1 FL=1
MLDWAAARDIGFSLSAIGVAMIFVQAFLIHKVLPVWGPQKTAIVGFIKKAMAGGK